MISNILRIHCVMVSHDLLWTDLEVNQREGEGERGREGEGEREREGGRERERERERVKNMCHAVSQTK